MVATKPKPKRKESAQEESAFTPSRYQAAIFDWIESGRGDAVVDAVAGSGKTRTLVEGAKLLKTEKALFCAFNKHIAEELERRLPRHVTVKTIHSLGYGAVTRHLGRCKLNNGKYRDLVKAEADDLAEAQYGRNVAYEQRDRARQMLGSVVGFAQSNLVNVTQLDALEDLISHYGIDTNGYDVRTVGSAADRVMTDGIAMAKHSKEIDFIDMIWLPVIWDLAVEQYEFIFGDEIQDLSRCQFALVKKARANGGRMLLVGDPCQPPDTKVLVVRKRGSKWGAIVTEEIPIQNVKVGDTVYAYSAKDGHFYSSAKVNGISKKPSDGHLVIAKVGDRESRYTPNHHCVASFAPFRDHYSVYVMQKGNQFRVGMSKVSIAKSSGTGVVSRLKQERADAVWILGFYRTREEAYIMEQAVSGKFGLPQLVFSDLPVKTKGLVEQAWKFIGDDFERAAACLEYFKRDIRYPLFKSGQNYNQSLKRPMVVQATNLVDGCLMLLFAEKSLAYSEDWRAAEIRSESYRGDVYSLDVEKYHTYVADGIVTHNCQAIMSFAGADAHSWQSIIDQLAPVELPLSICYRCPESHLELARAIVPHVESRPDAPLGAIERVKRSQLTAAVQEGDFILCRMTAPLISACIELIAARIPARVKGRDVGKQLTKIVREVGEARGFTYADFLQHLDDYRNERVARLQRKRDSEQQVESLDDRIAGIEACYHAYSANTFDELCREIEALFSDDRASCTLSTIHRAKGLEGDRVFLLHPEKLPFTRKGMREWEREAERCVHYVALTRSKEYLGFVDED